ncbi:MAG TPA: hypothetical protein VM888_07865, partial [Chitinophagaceae bacterium]|nr:hypothetical protein [Chitinophagaceae bacterium]
GYKGFMLGRYHREAQFYLIDCNFSENMADKPIYFVPGNKLQWGERIYYYDCNRKGGNYNWFKNNLQEAKGSPVAKGINSDWVFKGTWQPQAIIKNIKKRA